jgi:hypothetical protein
VQTIPRSSLSPPPLLPLGNFVRTRLFASRVGGVTRLPRPRTGFTALLHHGSTRATARRGCSMKTVAEFSFERIVGTAPTNLLTQHAWYRYGTVRYGTVRYGTVRYGTTSYYPCHISHITHHISHITYHISLPHKVNSQQVSTRTHSQPQLRLSV